MKLEPLDYEQIRQQLAAAAMDLDFGRAEDYAARFTSDATHDTVGAGDSSEPVPHGRDEIAELVTELFAESLGQTRHFTGPPVISQQVDGIHVDSYFQVLRTGAKSSAILTGIFHDVFRVSVDGQWLISARVYSIDPQP